MAKKPVAKTPITKKTRDTAIHKPAPAKSKLKTVKNPIKLNRGEIYRLPDGRFFQFKCVSKAFNPTGEKMALGYVASPACQKDLEKAFIKKETPPNSGSVGSPSHFTDAKVKVEYLKAGKRTGWAADVW